MRPVERETARGFRKLHVGCGENVLDGWLNTDLAPEAPDVFQLDVTQPFPFYDQSFDFLFSEHLIEHVTFSEGARMLAECHRVLSTNGTIRVSTPDLSFLIDLYRSDKSELQRAYVKWSTDQFLPELSLYADTVVINNFVRDWGHLFIYDEKTLRYSMEKAGFSEIKRCALNESEHEVFRNLENEARMPAGFLRLETFTLEGTKGPD